VTRWQRVGADREEWRLHSSKAMNSGCSARWSNENAAEATIAAHRELGQVQPPFEVANIFEQRFQGGDIEVIRAAEMLIDQPRVSPAGSSADSL
jgi:hypothetical protein